MNRTASSTSAAPILGHVTYGSGREKVLAFHDWMGDAANYEPMMPYLDPDAYTYVFADLRGYGRSRHLDGRYTAEEAAADGFRLADHLGWEQFHLVGHSMSGMVVQRMAVDDARRGNQRLQSVVAITPVAADGYPADTPTKDFLLSLIGELEPSMAGFSLLTGQRLSTGWSRAKATRHLQTSVPEALKGYYRMWLETDFSQEVRDAKLDLPFLIVGGRNDLPGFQEPHLRETFGQWLPSAAFAFIADAGHYPMQETPALLASTLEQFWTVQSRETVAG